MTLNLPVNLVKLLGFWYATQQINVKWKTVTTASVYMKNGTCQGSILSPYLFSVYMRDISSSVSMSGHGCHIGNMPCNVLLYAVDIVLISPSWHAQQYLLRMCSKIISSINMMLNAAKSVTIIFAPFRAHYRVSYKFPEFGIFRSLSFFK